MRRKETIMSTLTTRRAARRLGCTLAAGLLATTVAGCDLDRVLDVQDPDFATPGSLDDPAALPVLVAGAIGDFQVAYSGNGNDAFLSVVALFTDEFHAADTFITRSATDRRSNQPTAQGNTSNAAFNWLQAARRSLSDAADAVVRFSGENDARLTELRALEGYTYTALAEAFCSAIPFSDGSGGAPREAGPPLATAQVFDRAVARFDAALATAATAPAKGRHLAQIGKARALLNNGMHAEAAAAVASVPTSFVYFVEHSTNSARQYNPVVALQTNGRYSVSDREGGNGLDFRSAGDPRVPWVEDPAGGFDGSTRLFMNQRYQGLGADMPLATGIEARLIEAEALLRAGDTAGWLAKLNALRADVAPLMSALLPGHASVVPGPNNPSATLTPLSDPGSEAARVELMFRERAFWLFNTGHRLGDLRRLVRQYGCTPQQVFPSGDYFKGGQYGADVSFPIPFQEVNNPHFEHSMCDTTKA
jgi:starch-binding outer membrane protein, SusD/RagB family